MPHRAVLERSCDLDPAALSVRAARAFVRDVLTEAGRPEWIESTEVAVSEVVTNAYLHAHTALHVSARVEDDHVRVEVRDGSPVLPQPRSYEAEATTGRGMNVVAAVTIEHGVESLGLDGKIVWFCVGEQPVEASGDDLLAYWDDDDILLGAAPSDDSDVAVELRGMPPRLWLAAREHHDAMLRELALFRAEHPDEPAARTDLALADMARFAISGTLSRVLALAASRRGPAEPGQPAEGDPAAYPDRLDLLVEVRHDQAPAFCALQDALDEGERLAVADRLLVHPGLPEIIAVRDWACEQVIAQLAGIPPTAWPGADEERFTTEVHDRDGEPAAGWDVAIVRDSDRGAVAADDANRIIAVSAPFCAALGWRADDLVGRRVVTIVPHRFRETHVAGFSRHLSTGETNVVGTTLELPVLHADGHEVACEFRIDHERAAGGRSVYVAWITPVDGPTAS